MTPEQERALRERIAARHARERAERDAKWAATSDQQLLRMRIEESRGDIDPVTASFLGLAVPMWIDRMRAWDPDRRAFTGRELVETIAYEQSVAALADPEARGTAKKGEKARAFNAIAQGLACLAFCPGGVVFAGHHWEVSA